MQLFINNWSASLAAQAAIGVGVISIEPVKAAQLVGLGSGDYYLLTLALLDGGAETAWEIVRVTGVAGGDLTVLRAQEGTAELAWSIGTPVTARLTKGACDALRDSATPAAVRATEMSGLSLASAEPVGATDTLIEAIGKLQAQFAKPVITESTAARILTQADAWAYIRHTNAAPSSVTIAPQTDQAWGAGTEIHIRRAGAGDLTLTPGVGVTINAPNGGTLVLADAMTVTLKRVAADVWDVIGQTVAA